MKNIKFFFSIFLILFSYGISFSQDPTVPEVEEVEFSFVESADDAVTRAPVIYSTDVIQQRKRVLQGVVNDLIEAKGNRGMQKPVVEMRNTVKKGAWMNATRVQIGMEHKVYEICQTFGKDSLNAMAALMGHEIIHYYDKHNWSRRFARENTEVIASQQIGVSPEKVKNEAQADYLGGFLGFSAGYNTLGVMPKLLDKIYEAYRYNAFLPGYPSLFDRKIIANNSMEKLKVLANVHDMANYLRILEDFEASKEYFKYILKDFQSRDIYNNLGTVLLQEALTHFEDSELSKYGLPFELDAGSRLNAAGDRGSMTHHETSEMLDMGSSSDPMSTGSDGMGSASLPGSVMPIEFELLYEAIAIFEIAIDLDKEYAVALLNTACAYFLFEDDDEAEYFLRKAKKIAKQQENNKILAGIEILEGIIAAKNGENMNAEELFNNAISKGSQLAMTNLNILKNRPLEIPVTDDDQFYTEKIEDVILEEFVTEMTLDTSIRINNGPIFSIKEFPNSKLLMNRKDDSGEVFTVVHIANKDYTGKSEKDITINSSLKEVTKEYGNPVATTEHTLGHFAVYPYYNLVFSFDTGNEDPELNKVIQWCTYYQRF